MVQVIFNYHRGFRDSTGLQVRVSTVQERLLVRKTFEVTGCDTWIVTREASKLLNLQRVNKKGQHPATRKERKKMQRLQVSAKMLWKARSVDYE